MLRFGAPRSMAVVVSAKLPVLSGSKDQEPRVGVVKQHRDTA
jgi:hypothetical protein